MATVMEIKEDEEERMEDEGRAFELDLVVGKMATRMEPLGLIEFGACGGRVGVERGSGLLLAWGNC
jgi:hypothetical protein